MAAVLEDLGRYARAEAVQRTLVAELVKRVGEQHFLTYQAQHTLSRLVAAQGRYAEAEGLLLPAVQNMEAWLGREHHEAILSGAWIGALRREQGRFPEAEAIFKDVLNRCELQATCSSSPNTVGSLRSQVADVCFLQRRLPEALKIYRQTVAMSQGGDANSRGAIYMRVRLAEVLAETGSFQEAAGIMQAIPPSFAQTEYRLGVWVGRLRRVEGLLALHSRDHARAQAALAEALRIQEFRHGRDHWRTKRAREDLARVPGV
jgi:tetratricopeptide (TPR) repeat protein